MIAQPTRVVSPLIDHFLRTGLCRDYTGVPGEQFKLVTLNFPTANYQQPYYFASDTMLDGDNCTITAIDWVENPQLTKLPNGQSNFPAGRELQNGVLYVSNLKREIIAEMPLSIMARADNNGKPCFTSFDQQVWQNCYVQFTATAFTTPIRPLTFMVYYTPKIKK